MNETSVLSDLSQIDIVDLYREIQRRQRTPLAQGDGESNEAFEARIQAREALDDDWTGSLYYKGNSVSWSHSKSVNYGRALGQAWDALTKLGIPCDGQTTVADAIRRFIVKKEHSVREPT